MSKLIHIKVVDADNNTNLYVGKNSACKELNITRPTLDTYLKKGKTKDGKTIELITEEDYIKHKSTPAQSVTNLPVRLQYEAFEKMILEDEYYSKICIKSGRKGVFIDDTPITKSAYDDLYTKFTNIYTDTKIGKNDIKTWTKTYACKHITVDKDSGETKEWETKIMYDNEGKPLRNIQNACNYFEFNEFFRGKLLYNEFDNLIYWESDIFTDTDFKNFCLLYEKDLGGTADQNIDKAMAIVPRKFTYHPIKTPIEQLEWDGIQRASTYFIDICGVDNTPLNRSITIKWLYAMIKRIYEPGCKFDHMIIIHDSTQGTGKSTAVERIPQAIGLDDVVCTSLTCDPTEKDNIDKMNKSWIVSIEELTEFLKASPEKTKQLITQTSDMVRLPYGHRSESIKRHCVFYGTTNTPYFLKDYSGSFERRYWVMEAHGKRWDLRTDTEKYNDEYIRQVLAEVYYLYKTDPDFNYNYLSKEETDELTIIQDKHKTLQNDNVLQYQILSTLDKLYLKDTIYDIDEFSNLVESAIEQKADDDVVEDTKHDVLFNDIPRAIQTNNVLEGSRMSKYKPLRLVSSIALRGYIKNKFHRELTENYLERMIEFEWEKVERTYKKRKMNCYISRKKIEK